MKKYTIIIAYNTGSFTQTTRNASSTYEAIKELMNDAFIVEDSREVVSITVAETRELNQHGY